jgi:D-lactate dehydrogenase (cytochrome)
MDIFHVLFITDPYDFQQQEYAESFCERMVMRETLMDGTCTGEHGTGYGKLIFFRLSMVTLSI